MASAKYPKTKTDQIDHSVLGSISSLSPTQFLTASKSMKDFLLRLEARGFAGRNGFAFDTRYDGFMAGSAAKYIEKRLETTGIQIINPHTH